MKPIYLKLLLSSFFLLATTACDAKDSNPRKIASIPEASGISYCDNTDTLMVANDEGWYSEITPSGKIISQYKLGNYDLEGVFCEDNIITFAVEDGALLQVDRKSMEKKLLKVKSSEVKLNRPMGIEGITKIGDLYYLAIQAKKKKDSNLLVVKAGANYAKVIKIINHRVKDSSALEYKNKQLYIVSDDKDKLYIYDLKTETIKKKIKLPKFAQEGIAFGKNNDVFFADDNGAVMKYTLKELGL